MQQNLTPIPLHCYEGIQADFAKSTGCPMYYLQDMANGNGLVPISYLPHTEEISISNMPIHLLLENQTNPNYQFKVGHAGFEHETYGDILMTFIRMNDTRQTGHQKLDANKISWYVSALWNENGYTHRFNVHTNLFGEQSMSYSLRYPNVPLVYSNFVQTTSNQEESFRAALARIFIRKDGSIIEHEDYMALRETVKGTDIRDDWRMWIDYLHEELVFNVARHNQDIATIEDANYHNLILSKRIFVPENYRDGKETNLIKQPINTKIKQQLININCPDIANWEIGNNLRHLWPQNNIGLTDEQIFNKQYTIWQYCMDRLLVEGTTLLFNR